MSRKKGTSNVSRNNDGNGTSARSGAGSFQFINVKLSDEDAVYLDGQGATLQELSARVLSLCDDGYGIGVKCLDSGSTICVTLTHPASDNPDVTLGLSSFGGNVRDALLGLCFKFDHKLSGEFPESSNAAPPAKPRFR